jgi:beta-phosphoglucomutase-like phosphatase (HAD superfamily)
MLGLVIFDCDGVLVDSELISCRAHARVLTRHGYPITPDQVLERFLGVSDREARQIVETELGRKLPDDVEAEIKQETLRFYAGDLKAIAHVGEVMAAIDLPKCVASSGTPEKIHDGLSCAGLYEDFAPHKERCLVIEDSVPSVTGARAAAMTVLGFHGASHCRDGYGATLKAAGAHKTFDDMRQLPALIAQNEGSVAGFSAVQAISGP